MAGSWNEVGGVVDEIKSCSVAAASTRMRLGHVLVGQYGNKWNYSSCVM
jgi:hypothetical protein